MYYLIEHNNNVIKNVNNYMTMRELKSAATEILKKYANESECEITEKIIECINDLNTLKHILANVTDGRYAIASSRLNF